MIVKWSKNDLLNTKDGVISFQEDLTFPKETFAKIHQLRDLKDVHVEGSLDYDGKSDLVTVDMEISGEMILPCAITNEDVPYPFDIEPTEVFAFRKVDDTEDLHEAKGDVIELLPIIFQDIMMEVPLKVVKDDIKEYPKGEGWEVISESDYQKRKKDEVDPRLAKLAEFKIEED
ncbi:YceD family protein [Breznakia blatticola]|uniref:DUF177 domain-containing protein n=1 Tax=Breznakia blatticola TaxID=1754012 RepID=A0A4R8A6S9_9FIRM|nr:uncharacterized protein [Breznakia sp. PH1-1]MDH6403017.1 uncharacterized protein [Breznakia sp. PF1-11]MDH6410726.1 uncharacterized protein [Breznakia sp. PFB1-11]MDH6413217.1 uncharacterized protein [Breznakia sp. PFB1-14]MDH6415585.1 uncharacterized protein [Breznakia sp. PFB1-4]MDH6417884.1 uncharacterized protein [Breznakia sp. PFB1-12]MDH6472897.1 uncharacterized protein [Breznakia sp. PFB2-30]MDH6475325.1 uncharacterized protein [Breznakia sp. PFB1-19]TDW26366.1 uncharacterized pr